MTKKQKRSTAPSAAPARKKAKQVTQMIDSSSSGSDSDSDSSSSDDGNAPQRKRKQEQQQQQKPVVVASSSSSKKDSDSDSDSDSSDSSDEETEKQRAGRIKAERKQKKKEEKAKAKAKEAAGSGPLHPALEYLMLWNTARAAWKFKKVRQVYLLKNLYDPKRLPNKWFDVCMNYMADLRGKVRETTLQTAKEYVEAGPKGGSKASTAAKGGNDSDDSDSDSDSSDSSASEDESEAKAASEGKKSKIAKESAERHRRALAVVEALVE